MADASDENFASLNEYVETIDTDTLQILMSVLDGALLFYRFTMICWTASHLQKQKSAALFENSSRNETKRFADDSSPAGRNSEGCRRTSVALNSLTNQNSFCNDSNVDDLSQADLQISSDADARNENLDLSSWQFVGVVAKKLLENKAFPKMVVFSRFDFDTLSVDKICVRFHEHGVPFQRFPDASYFCRYSTSTS